MATSRWKDNKNKNIDDVIELLTDAVLDDEQDTGLSRISWQIVKQFTSNKEVKLLGSDYLYNVIKYSYMKVTRYGTEVDTIPQSGSIIVYSNGDTIGYIIDKPSEAQTVLRKLLSYSKRNEIIDYSLNFDSDFFIWLINRVYNGNVAIDIADDEVAECELQSIKGFRGDTDDLQTKVAATGESVMNIISTMSFVLESRKLNQIRLDIKYKSHEKIELVMKNGALTVDDNSYLGSYSGDEKLAKLYLLAYIEVVPVLKQAYKTDIENKCWNDRCYVNFLNNVSEDLQSKIKGKTEIINAKLEKENEEDDEQGE